MAPILSLRRWHNEHVNRRVLCSLLPRFKEKAKRRKWDLSELQKLIDLVLQNTPESMDILKRRHNMHRLSGNWAGRNECHVANSGDWLVIWSSNEKVAFFERTGSHDELFR